PPPAQLVPNHAALQCARERLRAHWHLVTALALTGRLALKRANTSNNHIAKVALVCPFAARAHSRLSPSPPSSRVSKPNGALMSPSSRRPHLLFFAVSLSPPSFPWRHLVFGFQSPPLDRFA